MPYDPNNIFAKIMRGEIPCHKIYEDDETFVFMDIMPQVNGHCLVLPKSPSRNLLDADPAALAQLMTSVQRVARAAMKAINATGCQIRQYNETVAGQTVFHLHFHVMPMSEGDTLRPHSGSMADQTVLARQAEQIRAALKTLP